MNGVALVGGTQINASLVRWVSPIRILRCALPLLVVAAVVLLIVALTGAGGPFGLLALLWVTLGIIQFIPPNAFAIALSRHGALAGTAAAFIGAMQAGVAGPSARSSACLAATHAPCAWS
jgi:DHA1 family bicyclomycin/chloramphenicol resistance-like MFS transporter